MPEAVVRGCVAPEDADVAIGVLRVPVRKEIDHVALLRLATGEQLFYGGKCIAFHQPAVGQILVVDRVAEATGAAHFTDPGKVAPAGSHN